MEENFPRRSSVKKIKEIYERKSVTDKRNSKDPSDEVRLSYSIKDRVMFIENQIKENEKNRHSFYTIFKNFGFDKYLNGENLQGNLKNNSLNVNDQLNINEENDKNMKNFCIDMESLCNDYEKQIGNYKKKLEECRKSENIKEPNEEESINSRKTSLIDNQENFEILNKEKCETGTNTEDLILDDLKYFVKKIDSELIIDKKISFEMIENHRIDKYQNKEFSVEELQSKVNNLKSLIEIHEEKISEKETENIKLKEIILNYFNEEEISRLDKMERKFQSYNNHINSMIDELLHMKKNDMHVFKFFSKEAVIEANKPKAIEKPNKVLQKESGNLNFSNYFKKLNTTKKEFNVSSKDSNKIINNLKSQIQLANKILIELISEILFLEYKQEYLSINFSSINTHIVDNFNVILNSIFLNEKTQSKTGNSVDSNFSIYHEYLQDVFYKIYQVYLREKMSMNSDSRIQIKDHNFMITHEFLTDDIIETIVEEVSNENSFFLLVYDTDRDFLPLDEWFDYKIENLINNNLQNLATLRNIGGNEDENYDGNETQRTVNLDKFAKFSSMNINLQEKLGDFGIFNSFGDSFDLNFIKNNKDEIKDNFTKRLDVLYDKFKYDMKQIVSKAKNYIHAGKVVVRNTILYDFSKYYTDYSSIEIKNNEILYNQINISQDTIVNFDNLNYNIKYNRNNFKGFYYSMDSRLNGKFITPKNISLTNTLIYLFNYCLNSLVTLSIRDYHFDGESLQNLNKIIEFTNNLSNLDISSNSLEDKGIRMISEAMKQNKTIKSINLSYNNITSNGLLYIGEFFLKNNIIERFFISGNNISGLGLQSLMSTLAKHKSIKHLDVSNNKLKDADILAISNFITKNLRFEGLNISYNYLDSNTLNQIGLSFKENKTLKYFKGTNLGLNVESTPYLLQHLSNTNVEEIYLDNNNIGETGGILISNVIKSNKKLKIVSLKNCNLDPNALTCICYSFEQNKNVRNIHLDLNKFDYESIEYLCNTIANKDITVSLSKSYIDTQIYSRIRGIQNIELN